MGLIALNEKQTGRSKLDPLPLDILMLSLAF
jgi:hypothetical protein